MDIENQDREWALTLYEESAHELFPLDISPEEYAARQGHLWLCFGFGNYRYRDEKLDTWIQRLDQIFFTLGLVEKYRQEILTPEELKQVRKQMEEEL